MREVISAFLLFTFLPLSAQKLTVEQATVYVGKTGYQQPVTAVFDLHNKSGRKLRIEAARPDCHCTTVSYPKGVLGDKFQITMTYDARQLGHFNKQVAIVTNGGDKPLYLTMTGVVLAGYTNPAGTYPVKMGSLRMDKADLEFDDINRGDMQVQELHIYNDGLTACRPNLMHLPSYLTATMTPERLEPDQHGVMTVTLNSNQLRDYGLTQSSVYLAANPGDKVNHDHEIGVSAVLLPSFVGMTGDQLLRAPKIELSKELVDIRFEGKRKKVDYIDISNHGQTVLNISSLELFTRGLKVSLNKSRLQPGETARLKITVQRDDLKKVRTRPRILMITNDPARPKVIITISTQ